MKYSAWLIACSLLCFGLFPTLRAQGAPEAEPPVTFRETLTLNDEDRKILTAFVGHAVMHAKGMTLENIRAKAEEQGVEMFCWQEFRHLDCLNTAYALTGNPRYLDLFQETFALFMGILEESEDGYLGWMGKPIPPRRSEADPDLRIEELQMTFRAIAIMARWVTLAEENPAYAEANQATIDAYLDLMENHLVPKWDQRGRFVQLPGRGGLYIGLDYPGHAGSLSFEKLSIMVEGLIQLYRATDNPVYLRRALQIGAWYRSNLIRVDDHYEWMSWVPSGTYDINPDREDAWRVGWMAPDPNGGWYTASVSIAVSLYQMGLLFDDEDLQRLLTTQKTRCWDGNLENPGYRTVGGVSPEENRHVRGDFLSFGLAPYDPILSELAFEGYHRQKALEQAGNPWRGGTVANEYIMQKYLRVPEVAGNPQPDSALGEAFLADQRNRLFHQTLQASAVPTEAPPPRGPSQLFTNPATGW